MGDLSKLEEYTIEILQRLTRVEEKLDTHLDGHKTKINLWPVWAGVFIAIVMAAIDFVRSFQA